MNLNDFQQFSSIDTLDMIGHINGLPDQLSAAWDLGKKQPLPNFTGIQNVLIAGMGGSAIGADILSAYIAPLCPVPVVVLRDYNLPGWAKGAHTLVIASSHSGNTEETLSAYEQAINNGCQVLVISTGGKLAAAGKAAGVPVWIFNHTATPRSAVGFSFGLLLAAFVRLGLIPDQEEAVKEAVLAMRDQQKTIRAEVEIGKNPAKRLAGQLVGRFVAVLGSDYLAPIARRWKGQISEIGKAWAQFEQLPEADHNTLAGLVNPEETLSRLAVIFLRAPSDHSQNQLRSRLTSEIMMREGVNTDYYEAKGSVPLSHIWTTLNFGDYVAYYLAMAYEVDPSPVDAIESLKVAMKK